VINYSLLIRQCRVWRGIGLNCTNKDCKLKSKCPDYRCAAKGDEEAFEEPTKRQDMKRIKEAWK